MSIYVYRLLLNIPLFTCLTLSESKHTPTDNEVMLSNVIWQLCFALSIDIYAIFTYIDPYIYTRS